MHCTARSNIAHYFYDKLKEGGVYVLRGFTVLSSDQYRILRDNRFVLSLHGSTIVKKVNEDVSLFNRHPFTLTPFEEIQPTEGKHFVDVVGYVTEIGPQVVTGTGARTVEFNLTNERKRQIRVTLWGALGEAMIKKKVDNPAVYSFILTSMSAKYFLGTLGLSSSTSTLLIDSPDVPALEAFKQSVSCVAISDVTRPITEEVVTVSTLAALIDGVRADMTKKKFTPPWFALGSVLFPCNRTYTMADGKRHYICGLQLLTPAHNVIGSVSPALPNCRNTDAQILQIQRKQYTLLNGYQQIYCGLSLVNSLGPALFVHAGHSMYLRTHRYTGPGVVPITCCCLTICSIPSFLPYNRTPKGGLPNQEAMPTTSQQANTDADILRRLKGKDLMYPNPPMVVSPVEPSAAHATSASPLVVVPLIDRSSPSGLGFQSGVSTRRQQNAEAAVSSAEEPSPREPVSHPSRRTTRAPRPSGYRARTPRRAAFTSTGIYVTYESLGAPTITCHNCSALMWYAERTMNATTSTGSIFSTCCQEGKVLLPRLVEAPEPLRSLLTNNEPHAVRFREKIRVYNSMFCFTSFGAKIDHGLNSGRNLYTFRISGQNYHRIGSLLPAAGQPPRYAQLYFYDTQNEVKNRMSALFGQDDGADSVDETIVSNLIAMLDEHSCVARAFRMARDWCEQHNRVDCHLRLLANVGNTSQYNRPTVSEIAVLITNDAEEDIEPRDVIVSAKDGSLQRISELHKLYMPLQYPLLFPYGEPGFNPQIRYHDNTGRRRTRRSCLTMREYYCYRIHYRHTDATTLLTGGRLFQQYLVDGYTGVEEQRLRWIRNNQTELRVELYHNVCDAVTRGDTNAEAIGQRIVLPATFTGGAQVYGSKLPGRNGFVSRVWQPSSFRYLHCKPKMAGARRHGFSDTWPESTRSARDCDSRFQTEAG